MVRSEPEHDLTKLTPAELLVGEQPERPRQPPALLALLQDLTVLVVDDDDLVRDATRVLLEDIGARVLTARDGADALGQLAAHAPDLVLADLLMPAIDGYQLVARLRGDPMRAGLPIIAVSAFTEPADRERSVRAGFDVHLGKPFTYAELARVFSAVMRRRPELLVRQLGRLRAFAKGERRKAQALRHEARQAVARRASLRCRPIGPPPRAEEQTRADATSTELPDCRRLPAEILPEPP
jgi:two-component system cell cycle response regulator DivK